MGARRMERAPRINGAVGPTSKLPILVWTDRAVPVQDLRRASWPRAGPPLRSQGLAAKPLHVHRVKQVRVNVPMSSSAELRRTARTGVKRSAEQSNSHKVDACDREAGELRRGLGGIGQRTGSGETLKKCPVTVESTYPEGIAVAEIVLVTGPCEVGGPEGIGDEVARVGWVLAELLLGGTRDPRLCLPNASFDRECFV
jgi:hypothetical protein